MMNRLNYQKLLDETILNIKEKQIKPTLLLHACCAPCSSYCLQYLANYFNITVLYYNPNIYPKDEFDYRSNEILRLLKEMGLDNSVKCIIDNYEHNEFLDTIKGLECEKEGGKRCEECFRLRLTRAASIAKQNGFDYFTTTLSISPLKNAELLNELGNEISQEFKVKYLFSDFKKKNGYKISISLSEKYNLYRQNYCGCEFSKR